MRLDEFIRREDERGEGREVDDAREQAREENQRALFLEQQKNSAEDTLIFGRLTSSLDHNLRLGHIQRLHNRHVTFNIIEVRDCVPG